jgi:ribosome maturation factor RimP
VPANDPSRARLLQLLTPVVEGAGHDLEDLTVSPAGRRRVVRVVVDKDGGSTLDDIAEVSRAVSDLLDEVEDQEPQLLGGAYVLEVSSPGVDRRLTLPRHWRRNTGRLVAAHLADGSTVTGRVLSADELEVVLDVDGTEQHLVLAQITAGAVQVEFNRREQEEDA